MKKGRLIIISGPSGVGKGSINSLLLMKNELKLDYSVSMTTRKPRQGEIDGVNYFFVDEATFKSAIENDELIEYAHFVGNYYGTPRKYVEEQLEQGKNVILEIEVDGATQVLQKEKNVLSIFLMPPNLTELSNRIRGRQTETEDKIKQRLDKALLEIPLKHQYDYIVENDNVENAVSKIEDILNLEKCSSKPYETKYEKLRKVVSEIVNSKYTYFTDNWEKNIKLLKKEPRGGFDARNYMVELLTELVYKKVLAHGDFKLLLIPDFVDFKIQKLMFTINFFSIEQQNNDKC